MLLQVLTHVEGELKVVVVHLVATILHSVGSDLAHHVLAPLHVADQVVTVPCRGAVVVVLLFAVEADPRQGLEVRPWPEALGGGLEERRVDAGVEDEEAVLRGRSPVGSFEAGQQRSTIGVEVHRARTHGDEHRRSMIGVLQRRRARRHRGDVAVRAAHGVLPAQPGELGPQRGDLLVQTCQVLHGFVRAPKLPARRRAQPGALRLQRGELPAQGGLLAEHVLRRPGRRSTLGTFAQPHTTHQKDGC
mmetsp:Transcript_127079/g.406638  ORF Transcript_127079/g.406638 Transcript_127079/m.406638 type:complete len:247 (-) Transcript_127079:112-852(-)